MTSIDFQPDPALEFPKPLAPYEVYLFHGERAAIVCPDHHCKHILLQPDYSDLTKGHDAVLPRDPLKGFVVFIGRVHPFYGNQVAGLPPLKVITADGPEIYQGSGEDYMVPMSIAEWGPIPGANLYSPTDILFRNFMNGATRRFWWDGEMWRHRCMSKRYIEAVMCRPWEEDDAWETPEEAQDEQTQEAL